MFSLNRLFDAKHLYRSRAGNDSRDCAPEMSLTTTTKREGSWDGIITCMRLKSQDHGQFREIDTSSFL